MQDTWKKIHKSVKAVYGGRICSQVLSLEWTTENDKAAYWKWGDWRRLIRMGMMSWVGSWFWRQGDEYWNQQLMKMCNQLLQWSRCGDNGMMSSNAVKKVSHQIGSHTRIDVFVHYVGELCLNQHNFNEKRKDACHQHTERCNVCTNRVVYGTLWKVEDKLLENLCLLTDCHFQAYIYNQSTNFTCTIS